VEVKMRPAGSLWEVCSSNEAAGKSRGNYPAEPAPMQQKKASPATSRAGQLVKGVFNYRQKGMTKRAALALPI